MRYVLVKWHGKLAGPMLHTAYKQEWLAAIRKLHETDGPLTSNNCRIITRDDTIWFDFQTDMSGKGHEETFESFFFRRPKFIDTKRFLEDNVYGVA